MPERERRPFREFLKELRHPEIAVGGGLAAAVLLGLLGYQALAPVALGDVMVEVWGLLFDAVLFGFLLVWVNVRRAKKDQIERYVEELEDYRRLETDLGSARSAGILVRLAKSGGGDRAPGGMYLAKADLRETDLTGAHLSQADLRGAYFRGAHLRGAHLRGANLSQAKLIQADLTEADLSGADLSPADLQGADLSGADLSGANLSQANLSGARLSRADLRGVHLRGADLHGAELSGANLNRADLRGAHLCRADFGGAYLHGANLCGADLSGAHFKGADLRGAHLRGADLSGVLDLEQWRLDSALGDRSTTLPDSLHHPEPWPQESTETPS